MLLIVTNSTDLASDYLILRLKSRGIPFVRLNTEAFGYGYCVELRLTKSRAGFLIEFSDGQKLEPKDITSVYFRQPHAPTLQGRVAEVDREFAEREALELLRSVWRMIPEKKWLNHPRNLWRAVNKVDQLLAALDLDLDIPTTLITSKKDSVASFIQDADGHIVAKAIKHGFLLRNDELWVATTQRLPSNYMAEFESFAQVPMTYQHEIRKICDLRVVIVRDAVFATAIYSQESEETVVDWRVGDLKQLQLRHEKVYLSKSLENKCKDLLRFFSLQYSSMDFALGEDGIYYFLELNPNGQWAWIEQLVGHPIRDAIIDTLIHRDEE
jgi:glutathione synthase/RimK-type ligase-like ATP-grasp enzyme